MQPNTNPVTPAHFRRGDLVRVKSPAQILATLDERGCLDEMPFMPEMLDACGRTFAVYARADKTCDTATRTGGRRLTNTVHLAGERCSGSSHGGCQAACLNFWKESWLEGVGTANGTKMASNIDNAEQPEEAREFLEQFTRITIKREEDEVVRFSCQATLLPTYTTPLAWWDMRQYWRDLTSRNVGFTHFMKVGLFALYGKIVATGIGYRFWVYLYDSVQNILNGPPWPRRQGTAKNFPAGTLDLKPGELVRIKSLDKILATVNTQNKNRGLFFDAEMVRYCGGTYRVKSRVDQIINEETGVMMHFSNPCIILEDVWCASEWSICRLFCPRSIFHYWREIWLERVPEIRD